MFMIPKMAENTCPIFTGTEIHSLDKVSTGLRYAAFIESELIVISAIANVIRSERMNGTKVAHTNGENPKFIR